MKKYSSLILMTLIGISLSCNKDAVKDGSCFPNTETYRQLKDAPAEIWENGSSHFLIMEDGTTDARLLPCNLPAEFQVNGLLITVGGDIKAFVHAGPAPCGRGWICNYKN